MRRALGAILALGAMLAVAALRGGPVAAQEPALEELRRAVGQPWLTLGMLLQTSLDLGLEEAPVSAQVRAARVLLSGSLDGGFSYFLQVNFAGAPSLLDARIGWSRGPGLAFYAGRFKTPFSRELLTYQGDLDLIGRSRVVDALAPDRQIGAQVGGAFGEHAAWSVGGFTGGEDRSRNEALVGVARLEGDAIPVRGGALSVAVHAAAGRDAAIAGRVNSVTFRGDGVLLGADARLELRRLVFAGEIMRAEWDPAAVADTNADGLYLTAGWTVRPDQQALVRWDRYRAPVGPASDFVVLGYNVWPTSASQIQANWWVPLDESGAPHKALVNLELRF